VVRYSAITGVEPSLQGIGCRAREVAIGLLAKIAECDEDLTVRSRAELAGSRNTTDPLSHYYHLDSNQ
jgi:hypothetical protein